MRVCTSDIAKRYVKKKHRRMNGGMSNYISIHEPPNRVQGRQVKWCKLLKESLEALFRKSYVILNHLDQVKWD